MCLNIDKKVFLMCSIEKLGLFYINDPSFIFELKKWILFNLGESIS